MPPGSALPRAFFERPALAVARDLLGAYLVRRLPDGSRLAGRIVEVEAYLGEDDPGSHAFRGPTPRNRVMFGPPGRLYVYRSYGIHVCANVVCERKGVAAAVLFRGLEPVEGSARMRALRGLPADAPLGAIASGPGKLARALDLGLDEYGASLLRGPLTLRGPGRGDPPLRLRRGERIGLSRGADLPYRFYAEGRPGVSR